MLAAELVRRRVAVIVAAAVKLAWISTERHSPNSQTAPSQSAESLTCRTRYVDWCADRAFCEWNSGKLVDHSGTPPPPRSSMGRFPTPPSIYDTPSTPPQNCFGMP